MAPFEGALSSDSDEDDDGNDQGKTGSFKKPPRKIARMTLPPQKKRGSDMGWTTVWSGRSFDDAKSFLKESSKVHCKGLPWIRDGKEKGSWQGVTSLCCSFRYSSGCKFRCRILRCYATGQCTVEESQGIVHADHKVHITAGTRITRVMSERRLRNQCFTTHTHTHTQHTHTHIHMHTQHTYTESHIHTHGHTYMHVHTHRGAQAGESRVPSTRRQTADWCS